MIQEQHTMPIGVVPNQLQALADELGQAKRTIAELRGLLMLAGEAFRCLFTGFMTRDECRCVNCQLKRDIQAVLSR